MTDFAALFLRPRWLDNCDDWRRTRALLTPDEREWFERHWELADGPPPADTSGDWITYERIRG